MRTPSSGPSLRALCVVPLVTSAFLLIGASSVSNDVRSAPEPLQTAPSEPTLLDGPILETPFTNFLDRADLAELFPVATDEQREQYREELREFYIDRAERPVWSSSGMPRREIHALLRILDRAHRHGLDPEMYRATALRESLDVALDRPILLPSHIAQLDVSLNAAALQYMHHLLEGRLDPDETEVEWHVPRPEVDLAETYRRVLAQDDIAQSLEALEPADPTYDGLQKMLAKYRALEAAGGWPIVAEGEGLAKGDPVEPERYAALVERLRQTGDLSAAEARRLRSKAERRAIPERSATVASFDPSVGRERALLTEAQADRPSLDQRALQVVPTARRKAPIYKGALVRAVRSFQERHGLEVDGKVGPKTLAAMNVPAAERVLQIEANLDRWRWLARRLPADRIQVNIADYTLKGYRDGQPDIEMRVVVGKPTWSTPVFADQLDYIEVNPYWNVPRSIAGAEIIPNTRSNPNYIQTQGMELFSWSTGERVDPSTVDWDTVTSSDIRVRQRPGQKNALGTMKFIFPNNFNVYLHDTPARRAFGRTHRALSHGCVRVHEPLALADWVLEPQSDRISPRDFRDKLASAENQRVDLETKLPVYLLYWTAFQDPLGRANFRSDIYDRDEELIEELEEQDERIEDLVAAASLTPATTDTPIVTSGL